MIYIIYISLLLWLGSSLPVVFVQITLQHPSQKWYDYVYVYVYVYRHCVFTLFYVDKKSVQEYPKDGSRDHIRSHIILLQHYDIRFDGPKTYGQQVT